MSLFRGVETLQWKKELSACDEREDRGCEVSYPAGARWWVASPATMDARGALNEGFQTLFSFISTHHIPMTAPVVIRISEAGPFHVRFFAGDAVCAEADDVKLDVWARGRRFAVRRFNGWFNGSDIEGVRSMARLLSNEHLKRDEVPREFFVAVFNSPLVPGVFRHNEVLVEIAHP